MSWLTGWNYKKLITIAGVSGAGTNYQVKLLVGESSGATGEDFDVNNHASNFPDDLRFTDNDGTTLLDYWVKEITGTTPNRLAKIWVEVADDLGSNVDICCYYGNSGANAVSNGENTFDFFDDFMGSSGNAPDDTKWTVEKKGSSGATVELDGDGHLHLAGASSVISSGNVKSKETFTNGILIEYKRYANQENYRDISLGYGTLCGSHGASAWWHTTFYDGYMWLIQTNAQAYIVEMNSAGYSYLTGELIPPDSGAWHTYQLVYRTDGYLDFIADGSSIGHVIDTTHLSNSKNILISQGEYSGGQGGLSDIDYILVRKYSSTEPSFSSAGNEEISGTTTSTTISTTSSSTSSTASTTSSTASSTSTASTTSSTASTTSTSTSSSSTSSTNSTTSSSTSSSTSTSSSSSSTTTTAPFAITETEVIFVGQIKNVSFKGATANIECVGFEHFLKMPVPTLRYQLTCNWKLFDSHCKIAPEDYKVSAVVTLDATETKLTSATFGGYDDGYFTGGFVEFGDDSRTIVAHEGNTITIAYRMKSLTDNDSVDAWPGCDGRAETCRDKFDNINNFLGFPFIPVDNPAIRTP